ncbi:MAG: hypothetical protein ACP5KI_00395 [Brevinematia bacterium]|jgi:hypothetical protein
MSEERIYDKKFIHYYFDEFPEEVEWVFSNRKVESFGDFGCGDGSLIYSLNKFGYFDNDIYLKSRLARFLRKFKLPIIGYYSWNILLEKL